MLTNIMRWLRRRVAGPAVFPDEYRAERMDAGWHPEFRDVRRDAPPMPVWGLCLLPR
jgi:hypothetical protein